MDYLKGGRGNSAPYTTTHVRIPEPIKPLVQEAAQYYRQTCCIPTLNVVTSLYEVDDEEVNNDRVSEVSDLETIQSQAETIRAYLSEINYLKHKLAQVDHQISLSSASEGARGIIQQKKSARVSLSKLLTYIYRVDIIEDHLNVTDSKEKND